MRASRAEWVKMRSSAMARCPVCLLLVLPILTTALSGSGSSLSDDVDLAEGGSGSGPDDEDLFDIFTGVRGGDDVIFRCYNCTGVSGEAGCNKTLVLYNPGHYITECNGHCMNLSAGNSIVFECIKDVPIRKATCMQNKGTRMCMCGQDLCNGPYLQQAPASQAPVFTSSTPEALTTETALFTEAISVPKPTGFGTEIVSVDKGIIPEVATGFEDNSVDKEIPVDGTDFHEETVSTETSLSEMGNDVDEKSVPLEKEVPNVGIIIDQEREFSSNRTYSENNETVPIENDIQETGTDVDANTISIEKDEPKFGTDLDLDEEIVSAPEDNVDTNLDADNESKMKDTPEITAKPMRTVSEGQRIYADISVLFSTVIAGFISKSFLFQGHR